MEKREARTGLNLRGGREREDLFEERRGGLRIEKREEEEEEEEEISLSIEVVWLEAQQQQSHRGGEREEMQSLEIGNFPNSHHLYLLVYFRIWSDTLAFVNG